LGVGPKARLFKQIQDFVAICDIEQVFVFDVLSAKAGLFRSLSNSLAAIRFAAADRSMSGQADSLRRFVQQCQRT